jgi:hypothetical protein
MISVKVSVVNGKELVNKLIGELSTSAIRTIKEWPNGDYVIFYTNGVIELHIGHDTNVIEIIIYSDTFKSLATHVDYIIGVIERNGFKTEDYVSISVHGG